MAKKGSKKGKKASKGKSAKGGKGDKEKKAKPKPTRCGPDFAWQPRAALVEAAQNNDLKRTKRLIGQGQDINEALHFAIGRGRLLVVEELLKNGADLHTEIKEGDYWIAPPRPPTPPPKAKGKKGSKKGGSKKKKKK